MKVQRFIHRHGFLGNARVAIYEMSFGSLRVETIRRTKGARESKSVLRFACGYTQVLSRQEAAEVLSQSR